MTDDGHDHPCCNSFGKLAEQCLVWDLQTGPTKSWGQGFVFWHRFALPTFFQKSLHGPFIELRQLFKCVLRTNVGHPLHTSPALSTACIWCSLTKFRSEDAHIVNRGGN